MTALDVRGKTLDRNTGGSGSDRMTKSDVATALAKMYFDAEQIYSVDKLIGAHKAAELMRRR